MLHEVNDRSGSWEPDGEHVGDLPPTATSLRECKPQPFGGSLHQRLCTGLRIPRRVAYAMELQGSTTQRAHGMYGSRTERLEDESLFRERPEGNESVRYHGLSQGVSVAEVFLSDLFLLFLDFL